LDIQDIHIFDHGYRIHSAQSESPTFLPTGVVLFSHAAFQISATGGFQLGMLLLLQPLGRTATATAMPIGGWDHFLDLLKS
jgi:hypothetical protein